MTGYVGPIEKLTEDNEYFRQVIFTAQYSQLVAMCLQPNEEIGVEVHPTTDQFFRVEKGEAKVMMNGEENLVKPGDAIVVPAGTQHNLINTSPTEPLKLYTLYSPPQHKDGVIHKTKAEAEADTTDHL